MTEIADNLFPEKYSPIRKLGEGGTAEVFLAQYLDRALPVALKLFKDTRSDELVSREMEIAGRIKYPGLVRLRRRGVAAGGRPFVEAEYCPGKTLDTLAGKVDAERLLAILSALSCSLYVLHGAGYIFNDLKCENVFMPGNFDPAAFPPDRLFYLKLNDFSLAQRIGDRPGTGATGTVGYMSPEMIMNEPVTASSDLFSLGVLAYNLACGDMPFTSDDNDPIKINAQVTEGSRPRFTGPGQSLPDNLKQLIYRLLEPEPKDRPASAFELTEELARLGSPYPYRQAVRPKHLLGHYSQIAQEDIQDVFGAGSFSKKQLKVLHEMTGFEIGNLRFLLEYNFDSGNFARLDGRWGWRNERGDTVKWPKLLTRLNLRLLRGKSFSFKLLAMALAIIGSDNDLFSVADIFSDDPDTLVDEWKRLPIECRPSLLYSIRQAISRRTRRILAGRLIPGYEGNEKYLDILGRLYHYSGHYDKAIKDLTAAACNAAQQARSDSAIDLLDTAFEAAVKSGSVAAQAQVALEKARLLKDMGLTQASEEQYLFALELIKQTDRVELLALAYKEIGDIYKIKSDYRSGIDVLNKALAIYRQIDDQLGVSHALNNLGNINWMAGEPDKSLEFYFQALDIQKSLDSDKEIASSLSNIGSIYLMRAEYKEGISYLHQSLEIKKRLGEKREIARTLNNIGVAHFLSGNMSSSIETYLKSLELNRDIGDRHEQLLNIENLAEAMTQAGRVKQALDYLREGLKLAEEEKSDFHQGDLTRLIGQLLRRMGNYLEAENKIHKALEIAERIDNKTQQMACYLGLARLHLALNELNQADSMAREAGRLAEKLGDKSALFYANLNLFDIHDDDKYRRIAMDLAKELNSPRETAQFHLTLLERANRLNQADEARRHYQSVREFFSDGNEDIDQIRYCIAAAHYHFLIQDISRASNLIENALSLEGFEILLPEQWQGQAMLSEITFANGELEDSFHHAQKTLDILKQISRQINDRERLGRLYNDQRIINLLGRIKSLQSVLGKKKGAALSNP